MTNKKISPWLPALPGESQKVKTPGSRLYPSEAHRDKKKK